jgi:acetoin utilization deacetylase AcuC-like enzyme
MQQTGFATYLHPETVATTKPLEQIRFVGHSHPHFSQVREAVAKALAAYPLLPRRLASFSDYGSIHSESYLKQLKQLAADSPGSQRPRLGGECAGLCHCLPGYEFGLGGMFEAIDQMKLGKVQRAYCFSLGGHHAHVDWGHGYCLLNPLAVAVRYAQKCGFARVLIVDWDIHHGDGTQTIFAHDASVYAISIHSALELYMAKVNGLRAGTSEAGADAGHCNIPLLHDRIQSSFVEKLGLPGKFYHGADSIRVFRDALHSLPWSPDLVCIFSGYDGHRDDCGKSVTNWTNADFAELTRIVRKLADSAGSPVLSVHGGGYNLPVTVDAAVTHVGALSGNES